nr:MAG TPA: hypothetical protein [Caudoviricetes sp.]
MAENYALKSDVIAPLELVIANNRPYRLNNSFL